MLLQWNGKTCNKDEKFKAGQYVSKIKVIVTIIVTKYHGL